MELYEANRILRSVKYALIADGCKLPSSAETDGLMMLLGKLDADKFLAPKIKRARAVAPSSAAYDREIKYVSFFRALQAIKATTTNPVTALSLMMLNKALCGDIDDNAGKPRAADASTNGNAHTDPKYISGSLKSIAAKMNEIPDSPETSKEDFAGYLSHYMRELIILRPFERGSEFTVRIFIMQFCRMKGFALCYNKVPFTAIKNAEAVALAADDVTPLFRLFAECLSYEQKTAQAQAQRVPPRTRREIAKDLRRPPRAAIPESGERRPAVQKQVRQIKRGGEPDDEVLKRAIRLQQKIAKLNEQLTELIQPLETDNDE